MLIKKIFKPMKRHFVSEPAIWAVGTLLSAIGSKLRGMLFSSIFNSDGIRIGSRSMIRGVKNISIGKYFFALDDFWLEAVVCYREQVFTPKISIGNRVSVSKNVHITCINSILIGNNVLMGSKIYISDHNHGNYSGLSQSRPDEPPADRVLYSNGVVVIEDNVWIGDNVVIVGPASIGFGAIIASNSVVKGNVPARSIVAGSPAKIIKYYNMDCNSWEKV